MNLIRARRWTGRVAAVAVVAACAWSAAAQDRPPQLELALVVEVATRDAEPVAGAAVSLLPDPPDLGGMRLVQGRFVPTVEPERAIATAETDEAGRARFAVPAPALYRVAVRATGFAVAVEHTPVARGTPAGPLRVVLDPGCSLRGRVTSKSGSGALGVVVLAAPPRRSSDHVEPALQLRATTGADGSYLLDGLPRGTYDMWTWRAAYGFVPLGTTRVPDETTFDAIVTDGGTVRGHVRAAKTGEALAGAVVELWEGSWRSSSVRFGPAKTDAAGAFEIRTGRHSVKIEVATLSCPGRADTLVEDLHTWLDDGASAVMDFEMAHEAVLTGRVDGPAGPVAGARVSVGATPHEWSMWNNEPSSGSAVAAADGTFRVGRLAAGYAIVRVGARADPTVHVELRAGETTTCELKVGASGTPELVTRRFSGRVLRPGGAPAAGASVWVWSDRGEGGYGDSTSTVTGADGAFSLVATGLSDRFRVVAKARGCAEASRWFEDLLADAPPFDITLEPLPSVQGTVRSSLGARVAGARVLVGERMILRFGRNFVDWERTPGTTVGDDGTYQVSLAPYRGPTSSHSGSYRDEYVVAVELPGHAPAVSASFALPDPKQPHLVDFELSGGFELKGHVTVARTGAVAPGVAITLSRWSATRDADPWPPKDAPGVDGKRTETGSDGAFVLRCLTPGRYLVSALLKNHAIECLQVDVPTSTSVEIVLVGITGAPSSAPDRR